jgi:DNA-binding response OmpR family regulator
MKILVCDDDNAIVSMVRFKLSREELGDVLTATDGREAIALLHKNDFDLVMMDINMPFHSGLEITTYIRQSLKKKTPILILSAEGLEDTVLQAFELGADDFVAKPFSLAELVLRVKRLVR